jgi:flagellar L-ring protein precursor FlgH
MLQVKRLIGLVIVLALVGCQKDAMVKPDDPFYAPVQPSHIAPPPASNGSLYQQNYSMALYGDSKAYRVGDVITILLTETTSSKKSNNASHSKSSDVEVTTPTIFGKTPIDLSVALENDSSFSGKGSAGQSNSLQGSITVTVHQLYPNGLMFVKGEKWLTLTNGSEVIRVSGLLRPEDVSPENTALSTKLADARLTYSGTGDLADSAKQGWLSRFFNSGWWPF